MDEQVARVTAVFDMVAEDYDQSGVSFFQPIAEQLATALDAQPGESAVDVGCGRGAVTLRLAGAVGSDGLVTAVDVAPAMVSLTREAAERAGLGHVNVEVMDATAPTLPEGSFDVLASSLVLFFLPEPDAALARWLRLLRPGGRAGVTTFGAQDDTWHAIDALFRPYLPPEMLDARTSGSSGPFASDAAMEELMRASGAADVRTVRQDLPVRFADTAQWRAFTMSTGQRAMWRFVPEAERPALLAAATELLDAARDETGAIVLHQDVRHTLGVRPA
jgi:ubiquinone/menaquinone biosynthesis C-methylase UbiE